MTHHSERYPIVKAKAQIKRDTPPKPFTVKGQVARTLQALVKAQKKGITALEMSSWAYRLGAYVHILRHKHKLEIETQREEHPGGWHGRYVLHTPAEILEVKNK